MSRLMSSPRRSAFSRLGATMLAALARRIGLGEYLVLGRGEEKTGGRRKQALLADGYEALIAAIYLDGGIEAARSFVTAQLAPGIAGAREPSSSQHDHKSTLQEFLQARNRPLPEYRLAAETGPDHRKVFHVELWIGDEVVTSAIGRTKKEAEQEAARLALAGLRSGSTP